MGVMLFVALAVAAMAAQQPPEAGGNTKKNGELIIEDSKLVSWMTINNNFNEDPGHTPWDGVLIQVGDYLHDGRPMNLFRSITFVDSHGVVLETLKAADFRWIDIVAVDPARTAPMGPQHLSLLYPEPGTTSGCSDYDAITCQR